MPDRRFRPTYANAFRLNDFPGGKLRLSLRREGGKKDSSETT